MPGPGRAFVLCAEHDRQLGGVSAFCRRDEVEFRILEFHRAETRPGNLALLYEVHDIPRERSDSWPLTFGQVDTSPSAGNPRADSNRDVSNSNRSLQGAPEATFTLGFGADWTMIRSA
jgi:hypothetical protein